MFKRFLHRLLGLLGSPPAHDILSQVFKDLCTAATVAGVGFLYTGTYAAGAELLLVAVLLFGAAVYFRQEG